MSKLVVYGALARALHFQNLRRMHERRAEYLEPVSLLARLLGWWTNA